MATSVNKNHREKLICVVDIISRGGRNELKKGIVGNYMMSCHVYEKMTSDKSYQLHTGDTVGVAHDETILKLCLSLVGVSLGEKNV